MSEKWRWFVSNGRKLRLLQKNAKISRFVSLHTVDPVTGMWLVLFSLNERQ